MLIILNKMPEFAIHFVLMEIKIVDITIYKFLRCSY